jgi:hypothetical protein
MATKISVKLDGPQGRFSTAPSLLIARQIGSNDAASAASAASYRYEARVRELHTRFENELQAVRDAYLQELAGIGRQGSGGLRKSRGSGCGSSSGPANHGWMGKDSRFAGWRHPIHDPRRNTKPERPVLIRFRKSQHPAGCFCYPTHSARKCGDGRGPSRLLPDSFSVRTTWHPAAFSFC